MVKALLGEPVGEGRVICRLCAHECRIDSGKTGICRVRKNIGGELVSLNADKLVALNLDPIEKKPLYHFLPGSRSFSLAAMGCNFSCRFCQNHSISMVGDEGAIEGEAVSPERLVEMAREKRARSISYTYTEPTVFFELVLETAKLARAAGLRNVLVSNGYMTGKALALLGPFLDGANIDVKSFSEEFYKKYCAARLGPVLDTVAAMRGMGIWLEITTLLIPGLNDDRRELAALIGFITRLDVNIPWHVSRFFPQHRLLAIEPTPANAIHDALQLGSSMGLKFVYGGNLDDLAWSDTRCPACGRVLIERRGYRVADIGLAAGACRWCAAKVPGIWE
jgi:pyruvate formate lyase activating enzyme